MHSTLCKSPDFGPHTSSGFLPLSPHLQLFSFSPLSLKSLHFNLFPHRSRCGSCNLVSIDHLPISPALFPTPCRHGLCHSLKTPFPGGLVLWPFCAILPPAMLLPSEVSLTQPLWGDVQLLAMSGASYSLKLDLAGLPCLLFTAWRTGSREQPPPRRQLPSQGSSLCRNRRCSSSGPAGSEPVSTVDWQFLGA